MEDVPSKLVGFSRRIIPVVAALGGLLVLVFAVPFLWVLVVPSDTTFNVVAETERVVMRVEHQVPWRWPLTQVGLRRGETVQTVSGSLELGFPVEVTFERVGFGMLSVDVTPAKAEGKTCEPATRFDESEEAKEQIGCDFSLLVDEIPARAARGETVVFTLEGDIAAGRPVGFETRGSGTALLRTGRVTLRERSIITRTLYEAGAQDLEAGDYFAVNKRNDDVPARGLVVVDERPAMTTAFRIIGREATIERPGGGRYPISTELLSRFANDRVFRFTSAIIAAIIGLITLSAAVVEGLDRRETTASKVDAPGSTTSSA